MSAPDFYMPYGGGHLPMGVVKIEAQEESDTLYGPRQVRMTIEAVSMGAPIMGDSPAPTVIREVAGHDCPAHGAHPHHGRTCLDCPVCRPADDPCANGCSDPAAHAEGGHDV